MTTGAVKPAAADGERVLTAEELEKLSSDSEGGPARRVGGWLGWLTGSVAFLIAAMALYWTQFSITTTVYRASFLTLCLALIFILYPLAKAGPDGQPQTRRPTIEELVVALIAIAMLAYVLHHPNPMFAVVGPLHLRLRAWLGADRLLRRLSAAGLQPLPRPPAAGGLVLRGAGALLRLVPLDQYRRVQDPRHAALGR